MKATDLITNRFEAGKHAPNQSSSLVLFLGMHRQIVDVDGVHFVAFGFYLYQIAVIASDNSNDIEIHAACQHSAVVMVGMIRRFRSARAPKTAADFPVRRTACQTR